MPKLPWQKSTDQETTVPEKGLAKVIRPDMNQLKEEPVKIEVKEEITKIVEKRPEAPKTVIKKVVEEPKRVEKMQSKTKQRVDVVEDPKDVASNVKHRELDEVVENAGKSSLHFHGPR